MHENDSSWNRHKSPRLLLYASLGIHKNLPMFLEKPPEEIIKTSRCFLESFGTLYSNDYTLPQSLKSIDVVSSGDALPWIVSAFLEMCMKLDSSA